MSTTFDGRILSIGFTRDRDGTITTISLSDGIGGVVTVRIPPAQRDRVTQVVRTADAEPEGLAAV